MEVKNDIIKNIQNHVLSLKKWLSENYTKEEIKEGDVDSPSYYNWQQIVIDFEILFKEISFKTLTNDLLDDIIFIISHQWDIGCLFVWWRKDTKISHIGMTSEQLIILSERALLSKSSDGKSQFAASLFKVDDKDKTKAIEILLKYIEDKGEYVRRQATQSLSRLNYKNINELLKRMWLNNDEYEMLACLYIWSETDKELYESYSEIAENSPIEYLRKYSKKLKEDIISRGDS